MKMNGREEPQLEWDTPMYRLAVSQLDRIAERMSLDPNIWERLRTPQRAHVVSFPFRRDDYETVETVFGYRVQHLLTMGPTKGGLRYDLGVDLGETTALAMWMSWKCSIMNLPFGGAKGGLGAGELVMEPRFGDLRQKAVSSVLCVRRQVRGGEGVVAHFVAGEHCSTDQRRVAVDEAPGQEEGDFKIQFPQEIEEVGGSVGRCVAVEGDRDRLTGVCHEVKNRG